MVIAKQLVQPFLSFDGILLGDFEDGHDVLLDRHAAKDRGFLRQIAKPPNGAAIHRQIGDVGPIKEYPAVIRLHQPHHRIETRSEEHTSELQSLMRISYAVSCLKKKNN